MIDEGARTEFNQSKKDLFYAQVDWLVEQGSLSEDNGKNINKGKALKLDFLKAQYNFTLTDKASLVDAIDKMTEEDLEEFYLSLTKNQINNYLK
jgi:hypothetical protein